MEIVLSFFVGILTSGIVGFFIYRRQKSESSLSERQILLLLSQQSKLTERIDDKLSANQSVFEKTFKDIQNEFRSAVREHDIEGALVSGAKYIDAAGSIADLNAKSLVQSNSDISHLTIEKLMKIHESIFPRGYELTGRFRSKMVWIGSAGMGPDDARFVPAPANRVPRLLSDLLSWWNGKFHEFKNGSEQEKVHAIAEFHHSLLSIHPFLDGNGRLARTLLQMQIEELFEKTANINPRPKNYYDALHKADWGDMNQLESIIRKCVSAS